MGKFTDLDGVLADTFKIGKLSLDSSALTTARTHIAIDEDTTGYTQVEKNKLANVPIIPDIHLKEVIVGTSPILLSKFSLPAGVYTTTRAMFGTSAETTTAYIDIRKSTGEILKTLSNTGLVSSVSTTGFTLTATTEIWVFLFGGNSETISFSFSLGII